MIESILKNVLKETLNNSSLANPCFLQYVIYKLLSELSNPIILKSKKHTYYLKEMTTVKHLNSGQLPVLKNLSVIEKRPLLGGSLTKIVAFGTKRFIRYSRHVRYFGCPLLGGFTVLSIL